MKGTLNEVLFNSDLAQSVPACRQAGSKGQNVYTVYALQSEKNGRLYIGMSEDPIRRLNEHNTGQVKSTKAFRPYKIVLMQKVPDRITARKLEKKWKSGSGREAIKKLIIPT